MIELTREQNLPAPMLRQVNETLKAVLGLV